MPPGRKSRYHSHIQPHLELIAAWCRDGATEKDICEKLGVSVSAFSEYKNRYPELLEALKINKEIADQRVINALYKSAVGYEYDEIRTTYIEGENQARSANSSARSSAATKKLVVKVTKRVLPNVTAQIFWLKNRLADHWRDKQQLEHTGDLIIKLDKEESNV